MDFSIGITVISLLQNQGWASPAMRMASALGSMEFFLLFMPAIYWCFDLRLGLRLAFILAIGHGLGEVLKIAFHSPRPYWVSNEVKALSSYPSFGFPSSHALDATCVWGVLASSSRQPLAWAAASILVLVIGSSRAYLAVHFPWDVIAGWLTGAILLLAFIKGEPSFCRWFWHLTIGNQILTSFLASAAMLALYASSKASLNGWQVPESWYANAIASTGSAINPLNPSEVLVCAGLVFGVASGYSILARFGRFKADGAMSKRLERYILGMIGLILIWYGAGSVFPYHGSLADYAIIYMRSAMAGSWVSLIAPVLFMKMGIAYGIDAVEEHII